MTQPQLTRELDRAGVGVMAFRLLAHVTRRADREGAATVTLASVAAVCGVDEENVSDGLRELATPGLVSVRRDGTAAHVTLAGSVIGELVVPAWVDDADLTPAAVRVYLHHVRRAREELVWTRPEVASRVCRLTLDELAAAEQELLEQGFLAWRGHDLSCRVFRVSTPLAVVVTRGIGTQTRAGW